MATTPDFPEFSLDIREQAARIDSLLADTHQALANANKLRDEPSKLRRDRHLAPWTLLATGLGAGAALFAAGATFMKIITG